MKVKTQKRSIVSYSTSIDLFGSKVQQHCAAVILVSYVELGFFLSNSREDFSSGFRRTVRVRRSYLRFMMRLSLLLGQCLYHTCVLV